MDKHQIIILILAFFLPFLGFSQNQFLDFIINKDNDTVFGTIRNVDLKTRTLYEKRNKTKKNKKKYILHKIKNQKKIRHNDLVYKYIKPSYDDGIYEKKDLSIINKDSVYRRIGNFFNIQKRLQDFVITNTEDTIYGRIKDPVLGKLHLIDSSNTKINIEGEIIKSYRFDNESYKYEQYKKGVISEKEGTYVKLIYNGKLKLYEHEYIYKSYDGDFFTPSIKSNKGYFIQKNDELFPVGNLYSKKAVEFFSENPNLVSKIMNKEYVRDNIYLVVKYFSEN